MGTFGMMVQKVVTNTKAQMEKSYS